MKLRNTFIKMFSIAFAVCAAFAIATMPTAKTVNAEESASFKANGASIFVYDGEDEGKVGLKFEAEFNTAWLTANPAEKYTFGMIVAPTANFTAWDGDATPTANMEAVDGVNIIRIQNSQLSAGATFGASILFDDESLKATIAEKLEIEVANVTPQQLASLKEEVYVQSYSAVAYATFGEEIVYLDKIDTSMRETAIDMLAVAVNEEDFDAMAFAFNYIGITEDDMFLEQAYVVNNVLTVDSSDDFVIEESDVIMAGGKVLALGVDYTLENGVATFAKLDKTLEGICVLRDTSLIAVATTFADAALADSDDVVDFFMNKDNFVYSEANKAHYNTRTAVLANDIDMSEELIYNYTWVFFSGTFDGRGHVLSNVTVQTINPDAKKDSSYGLFGSVQEGGIIKNVAFNDIKAVDHQANGAVIGYGFAGTMENVYVSYSVDNMSKSGMFVTAESGTMRNVVVLDNYYDPNFDVDTYITDNKDSWGVSPIVRSVGTKSATYENVQVISRRPINYYATGSDKLDVVYTPSTDGVTPATVSSWGAKAVYGENETDLWVEFDYFYRPVDDIDAPGLGLDRETATVQDTVGSGKTIVMSGLRRYDDMAALMADENNAGNRDNLIYSGFFKVVDDELVWANDENISDPCLFVNEVEYDASTGILYSTAWNGEKINKITLGGVVLTAEENGGLVLDADDNIVGIRAKVNASDEIVGIEYRENNSNSSNLIKYDGAIRVYTDNQVYAIRNIKYYTQFIFNATDLRKAVGYDVDYSVANVGSTGTDGMDDPVTERDARYNGKGYFVATMREGVYSGNVLTGYNYYEGVYNVGFYKMMANVDMEKAGIGYVNNPLASGSKVGGFVGYFDGNGYTIDNYAADKQGIFGRVGTYVSGKEVYTGSNERYVRYNPTIKNFAITNVITSYYDAENFYSTPILATLLGTDTYAATPNTTTVENIYVTVSTTDSTAPGSFVVHLGGHTKMNNVYIENKNEFDMVEVDGKVYTMTDDGSRPVVANGTKVWNVMKNWKTASEGVLFGWAYSGIYGTPGNDYVATEALDNTTNVHVVTTMPINFSSKSSMFIYPYHASYTGIQFSAEKGINFNNDNVYKLGKINKDKTNVYVAVAYAANETVGNILIPYGFKQSAIDEVKYILSSTENGGLGKASIGDYGGTAFMCNRCGEIVFSVEGRTFAKFDECIDEECSGQYASVDSFKVPNSKNKYGTGPLASPCLYTFTVHTASDMGEYYDHTNGAIKLKGVYKYADADAMKNAVNDYSSFTGAAGNGMWEVVETKDGDNVTARELKWVGRAA